MRKILLIGIYIVIFIIGNGYFFYKYCKKSRSNKTDETADDLNKLMDSDKSHPFRQNPPDSYVKNKNSSKNSSKDNLGKTKAD